MTETVLYHVAGGLLVAIPACAIVLYFCAHPHEFRKAWNEIWDDFNGGPPAAA
jgi:hypothetical protein